MATHRAHKLLHANPVVWLGEIKRQDPRLPNRLLLLKGVKESQNQAGRWSFIGTDTITPQKHRYEDPVIPLPLPALTLYPAPFTTVLKFTAPTGYRGALPKTEPSEQSEPSQGTGGDKPSADQLLYVYNSLQTNLPNLFTHMMDYTIYSQDIVFVNNILNKTTHGLFKYVQQVALLRLVGHLRYAFVRLELVSMSQHPLEGRITVKWRIIGISGLRVMLKFWKFKFWKREEMMQQQEVWYDAISHFDVGPDGLVCKHTVDRVEQDKEQLEVRKTSKSGLLAKLALIAALIPRDEWGESIASLTNTATSTEMVKGQCQSPIMPQSHQDLL